MAILDIQRKGQQIGRIRIGQLVPVKPGADKMRPAKLDTFRFTTASKVAADAIAGLYGGTVQPWGNEWEVVTRESAIGVTVPPRDQVVSQHYEMWTAGGCQRRCDSQHEQISNGPCLCPHAADPADAEAVDAAARQRSEMAKRNPPAACKPVTRVNVMIPDLPGLGVFRLDTGGYYAAAEIGDSAALMQMARDKGVFLPAILRIDQRSRIVNGETRKYAVPVLEVLATFRQIASGELGSGGITAQLPPPPGEAPRALTASPAASGAPAEPEPPSAEDVLYQRAQAIADGARGLSPDQLSACGSRVKAEQVLAEQHVCTDRENDSWEPLGEFLEAVWREQKARGRRVSQGTA